MLQAGGLPDRRARRRARRPRPRALAGPLARDAVLDRAGLAPLAGRRVDTLSGGETQRVRFAMAIAGDPDLVFLDEPTVAMDVESRRAFWDDMRRSAAEGRTVLFATHYLDEADQVADRIVVLDHGRRRRRRLAGGAQGHRGGADASRFVLGGTASRDAAARALPGVDRRRPATATRSRSLTRDADATVRALVAVGCRRSAISRSPAPTWTPRSSR